MASLTEDPGKTYRIPWPRHQLWMPGVLEFAAVVGIAAAWIGCIRSIFRPSGGK